MRYSPIARDLTTNRELFLPKRVFLETVDEPAVLNCAILHGWHSLYQPLKGLEDTLRALPSGQRVRFWRVTYDTHWKTFGQSAREIAIALKKQGVEPKNTLLIGYSMGGIVSRAMIADGFGASGALCLCSPHLGPAPWMPSGDIGSLSIAPWSAKLARLNRHPLDVRRRGDYFFQAFTFRDRTGVQKHDRIVTQRSALGEGLEGPITRNSHELEYRGVAPTCDPHLHGMAPQFLPEAIEWCERKFAAMALEK
ncbi:MAG TPA: alpha/beta fold hydrolase [Abditibacterium sp.]|jgi:pimeloyl-ACP methyl ester carboxylesterase